MELPIQGGRSLTNDLLCTTVVLIMQAGSDAVIEVQGEETKE
jgi:hypothetical protein